MSSVVFDFFFLSVRKVDFIDYYLHFYLLLPVPTPSGPEHASLAPWPHLRATSSLMTSSIGSRSLVGPHHAGALDSVFDSCIVPRVNGDPHVNPYARPQPIGIGGLLSLFAESAHPPDPRPPRAPSPALPFTFEITNFLVFFAFVYRSPSKSSMF